MNTKGLSKQWCFGLGLAAIIPVLLLLATLQSPHVLNWACRALPFCIAGVLAHIGLWQWFRFAEARHRDKIINAMTAVITTADSERQRTLIAELQQRFEHADSKQHERIALGLVAQAALFAGATEVMHKEQDVGNYAAVVFTGFFGFLLNNVAMLSVWIIGERTRTAFHALAEVSPIHRLFRSSLTGGITGNLLMHHILPLMLSLMWITLIAGGIFEVW